MNTIQHTKEPLNIPNELLDEIIAQYLKKHFNFFNLTKNEYDERILPLFSISKTIALKYNLDFNIKNLAQECKVVLSEGISSPALLILDFQEKIKEKLEAKGYNISDISIMCEYGQQLKVMLELINNGDFDKLEAKGYDIYELYELCANEQKLKVMLKLINNGDFDKLEAKGYNISIISHICEYENELHLKEALKSV